MIKYTIQATKPSTNFVDIEINIKDIITPEIKLQLPAWRPGRYELANFAKNIQYFKAFANDGTQLPVAKITKDCWEILVDDFSEITVKYNYYAAEINAGSTFVDHTQLYVNPINCCMYIPERIAEPCHITIKTPDNWQVATGMKAVGKHTFETLDFHELADSPFIASPTLKHHTFKNNSVLFHIWFQGECKPDFNQIESDFSKFITTQIAAMGDFPVKEYHFLFQILPYRTYHGVEHTNSTVIAMGPSWDVFKKSGWYDEFLGVSSHELFHTWNVKQIRPEEMQPYDYTKENYTYLGYLDEGVTTYLGDLFLLKSGVHNWQQFTKNFNNLLERHFRNGGRQNLSLAASSFDTWLDGYSKGIPNRKVSIYTEGALCAFVTDIFIIKHTNGKQSLLDVMKLLYNDFAKHGLGVSDDDYKTAVEKIAQADFTDIFENLIFGTENYLPYLKEMLQEVGCQLKEAPAEKYYEAYLGFVLDKNNVVTDCFKNSPAENAGIAVSDKLVSINNIFPIDDWHEWFNYFNNEKVILTVKKLNGTLQNIALTLSKNNVVLAKYTLEKLPKANESQTMYFNSWTNQKF